MRKGLRFYLNTWEACMAPAYHLSLFDRMRLFAAGLILNGAPWREFRRVLHEHRLCCKRCGGVET